MGRQYSAGPQASRLAWYDRNPISGVARYNGWNVAPHSLTLRVAYTCPTGKKAMVEFLQVRAIRAAAATTAGLVLVFWEFYPLGGGPYIFLLGSFRTNVVGDETVQAIGSAITMVATDKIEGYSQDGSTAGEVDIHIAYKATEFDA